jgi:tRNA threonylcarbamoyl adenosine modification protein YjeE
MYLPDPAATEALGRRLGERAHDGLVIALAGDLGTGKSSLARAIGRGLGVEGRIPSPTFVIANHYVGRLPFHHLDLYRLEEAEELAQLGLDEIVGNGVTAIEWAERFPELLPADHLVLALSDEGDGRRVHASGGPLALRWWREIVG